MALGLQGARMASEDGGSFEDRLKAARTKQALDTPVPAKDTAGTASPMGIGVRVGVELVSALVVAVAIGFALDWWLGTKPWLLGLFVLLGGAAGVANVWRLLMPRKR